MSEGRLGRKALIELLGKHADCFMPCACDERPGPCSMLADQILELQSLSAEQIERAAEALREYETKDASGVVPWENLNEKIKQHFRGKVRVVVDSIEVAE